MECAITCQYFLDMFVHVFGARETFLKEPDCETDQGHELSHLEEVSHFLKHSSCEEEHKPTTTTKTAHSLQKERERWNSFWSCYCRNRERKSTGNNNWQRVLSPKGWLTLSIFLSLFILTHSSLFHSFFPFL